MGELGDVFELVVRGPLKATSFVAECRQFFPRDGGREGRYRVWWSADGHVREEGRDERDRRVSLYVEAGSRWWRWLDGRGAVTNALGDPSEHTTSELASMLLDHGRLVVDPRTRIDRREVIAGREAIVLDLPEREIWVDDEYGVTLRSVHRGDLFFEVNEISFGIPIPRDLFDFSPPAGVELRAASSDRSVPRPIEEVAARVDFRVFAPGPVVLSWPVDAQRWPARGGRPEVVTVRLRESPIWIHQSAGPDPESLASRFGAPEEWSHIVTDGIELDLRDDPAVVRLVKEGIHIEVYGEADNIEELVAIALALRPVTPS